MRILENKEHTTNTYSLEGFSSKNRGAVKDETGNFKFRSQTEHKIYKFILAVENTNRAATAEFLVVRCPANSGSRAYE